MTRRAARLVVMMIRPPVVLVIFLFAALGVAQGGNAEALHPLFTLVPLIVGGWFINATVLNDLGDEAIDRVNLVQARGRPLVSGDATRAEMLLLGQVAGALGLAIAWTLNWRVGLVVLAGLALNAAYSLRPMRICDRGALASLLLPSGYVAVPYLVGLLAVKPSLDRRDLLLLVGLYVTFVGRILLKDFRDVCGDEMFGKRTFLIRHGRVRTCLFSAGCWVVGSSVLLFLYPWHSIVIGVFVLYLGCALHGLYRLAGTSDLVSDQVVIGAIAQTGRGMGVALLAHLTMVDKAWSSGSQLLIMAVLAALYAGMYAAALSERERVTAIRPY